MPFERAMKASCIHRHDYITPYVSDLGRVVDMEAIAAAKIRIGIDPLGGQPSLTGSPLPSGTASIWRSSMTPLIKPFRSCPWTRTARSGWTARLHRSAALHVDIQ
jgi:hypothetical protein